MFNGLPAPEQRTYYLIPSLRTKYYLLCGHEAPHPEQLGHPGDGVHGVPGHRHRARVDEVHHEAQLGEGHPLRVPQDDHLQQETV